MKQEGNGQGMVWWLWVGLSEGGGEGGVIGKVRLGKMDEVFFEVRGGEYVFCIAGPVVVVSYHRSFLNLGE